MTTITELLTNAITARHGWAVGEQAQQIIKCACDRDTSTDDLLRLLDEQNGCAVGLIREYLRDSVWLLGEEHAHHIEYLVNVIEAWIDGELVAEEVER